MEDNEELVAFSTERAGSILDRVEQRNQYLKDTMKAKRAAKQIEDTIAFENKVIIILMLAVACLWVYVRVRSVIDRYPQEKALFKSKQFNLPTDHMSAHIRLISNQKPRGSSQYSFTDVVLAGDYPHFYNLKMSGFGAEQLQTSGAHFLLIMLQEFPEHITKIHWSGNEQQLQYNLKPAFVSSYGAWNSPANPFSFLLSGSLESFERSCLIRETTVNAGEFTIVDALYSGGFCKVAAMYGLNTTTGPILASKILGRAAKFTRKCDAHKAEAGVLAASNVIGGGAGIIGGMSATVGLAGCNPLSAAFSFGVSCAVAATVVAGTAAGAYVYGKRVADNTRCTLDEDEERLSPDSDDYILTSACEFDTYKNDD